MRNTKKKKIGCIIPCYRGGSKTIEIIGKLLRDDSIKMICLVDDKCPVSTGVLLKKDSQAKSGSRLFSRENLGVGAPQSWA